MNTVSKDEFLSCKSECSNETKKVSVDSNESVKCFNQAVKYPNMMTKLSSCISCCNSNRNELTNEASISNCQNYC